MDFRQLICNWHSKAEEEGDYFSKFVFEYLAFIAYLKKIEFYNARNDRGAIQSLKQDVAIKNKYLEKIKNGKDLCEAWGKIVAELKSKPLHNVSDSMGEAEAIKWWNCSHDNLGQQTDCEKSKVKGIISSDEDWENMVEYWYSIRNNFFHGGKDPEDQRDNFLVEYGYRTLSQLVDIFLGQSPF